MFAVDRTLIPTDTQSALSPSEDESIDSVPGGEHSPKEVLSPAATHATTAAGTARRTVRGKMIVVRPQKTDSFSQLAVSSR